MIDYFTSWEWLSNDGNSTYTFERVSDTRASITRTKGTTKEGPVFGDLSKTAPDRKAWLDVDFDKLEWDGPTGQVTARIDSDSDPEMAFRTDGGNGDKLGAWRRGRSLVTPPGR